MDDLLGIKVNSHDALKWTVLKVDAAKGANWTVLRNLFERPFLCLQKYFRRSNSVILELRFLNVSLGVQTKSGVSVLQRFTIEFPYARLIFQTWIFSNHLLFFFKTAQNSTKMNENSDLNVK